MDTEAIHTLKDGTALRVTGNNLFVVPDPVEKESAGGILYAGDAVAHVYNTGVVVARGYVMSQADFHTPISGIKKGDRVLFIRYLAKQDSNIQMCQRLGEEVIRIRPSDVQLVFDDEDLPRVRPDL